MPFESHCQWVSLWDVALLLTFVRFFPSMPLESHCCWVSLWDVALLLTSVCFYPSMPFESHCCWVALWDVALLLTLHHLLVFSVRSVFLSKSSYLQVWSDSIGHLGHTSWAWLLYIMLPGVHLAVPCWVPWASFGISFLCRVQLPHEQISCLCLFTLCIARH